MKKCPHYLEYTWGEPPSEPDGEGQRHKEFECKLAQHYFIAAECEGDITKCNLPDRLYKFLEDGRAKERELKAENQKQRAKIEELEKINEDNLSVITEMGEHNAKLYNELKQFKQDYKDHTKVLCDKLNDQIEYGKQDREKIERLTKDIKQIPETIREYYGLNVDNQIKELDIESIAWNSLKREKEKSKAVHEAAEKEKEQIIQIIKQQRWHFSDVEWKNLLNRIQALAKGE